MKNDHFRGGQSQIISSNNSSESKSASLGSDRSHCDYQRINIILKRKAYKLILTEVFFINIYLFGIPPIQ